MPASCWRGASPRPETCGSSSIWSCLSFSSAASAGGSISAPRCATTCYTELGASRLKTFVGATHASPWLRCPASGNAQEGEACLAPTDRDLLWRRIENPPGRIAPAQNPNRPQSAASDAEEGRLDLFVAGELLRRRGVDHPPLAHHVHIIHKL